MFDGSLVRKVAVLATACLVAVFGAPGAAAGPAVSADVGPEHPVSSPIEGPVVGNVSSADVAFDGTNHLVVWTDFRSGSAGGSDVYGARVTPQGVLLDPVGIPIATLPGQQVQPVVAFGDGVFVVAWTTSDPQAPVDVHATRVTSAGTVLDPGGIPLVAAGSGHGDVDVAYGDGTFLFVWADAGWLPDGDVSGARMTANGSVLDDEAIPISTAPRVQHQPSVAFGDDAFMVAWADHRDDPAAADVFGARVAPDGSVLDPAGVGFASGPGNSQAPKVAFNGRHHLVVWHEADELGGGLLATRVDPAGSVVDPVPITVRPPVAEWFTVPAVTTLGSTFLVAWSDSTGGRSDVVGARLDADGTNLDPSGFVIARATGWGGPAVASQGASAFVLWPDQRLGPVQLFGTSVGPDASVAGPGTLLTRSANAQSQSAIASDGANHLVVWVDNRGGRSGLYATRMRPDGTRLDVPDIAVSRGGSPTEPTVSFDGTDFVVAWHEDNRVFVARIDRVGNLTGPPITLPELPYGQAISNLRSASTAASVLLVWNEFSRAGSVVRIWRIGSDGTFAPEPTLLADGCCASVATNGQDYLVTWSASYRDPDAVRAARVTWEGVVVDPTGFTIDAGTPTGGTGVAWNGQRYLVAWTADGTDIVGARVTAEAVVEDPNPIVIASGVDGPETSPWPEVAADAGPFLVGWRETDEDTLTHEIVGTRVGDDGTVLDAPAFRIATGVEPWGHVALAAGPRSTWGASYDRFVPESPYSAQRVFFRNVSPK